jgi:uncharacterized Zn-finger protein
METKEESTLLGLLKTSKSINKQVVVIEQKKRKKNPGFREFWSRYVRQSIDRSPNFKEYLKELDLIKKIAKHESEFSFSRFKEMAEDCRKKKDKTAFLTLQKFYREVMRILCENPEIKNRHPKYWIELSIWCQHILSYDFEAFLQNQVPSALSPNLYLFPIPVALSPFVSPIMGINLPQPVLKKEEESSSSSHLDEEAFKRIKLKFEDS